MPLCQYQGVTSADLHKFSLIADKEFEYKLLLDDLPSAVIKKFENEHDLSYDDTIPIAQRTDQGIKVFNHLHLKVETHN